MHVSSSTTRVLVRRRLAYFSGTLLAVLLVTLWSLSAGAGEGFVDDDGSVHERDIEYIAGQGITRGCNPPANDRFCPDRPLTRGEMAAFLARALDLEGSTADHFDDDDGSTFETEIDAVADRGITRGCNPPANDRFCPDERLTRGQMAAFLTRALSLDAGPDAFVDDDGSIFAADIDAIARVGLTRGCNPPVNDRYCPDDLLTRAQMATYLRRAHEIRTTGTTVTTTPAGDGTEGTMHVPPPGALGDLSDAVRIPVGSTIQSVVDAHPSGTTFLIEKGVHRGQTIAPRTGDRFVGESGAILDGNGTTEYAFGGGGNDVVIENLVIRSYRSGRDEGAVRSVGGGLRWVIRYNEIHHNSGAGIWINPGWQVTKNYIHHNTQIGIIGGGSGIHIADNEISYNNPDRVENPYRAGGGVKLYNTTGARITGNYSHHNRGPGLWTDGNNVDVLYRGNRVEANGHAGIKHELSCDATIEENIAIGNGFENDDWVEGGGIVVMNSPNVEVIGNTVRMNHDGIGAVHTERSPKSGPNCAYELRNLLVAENSIRMEHGHTGLVTSPYRDEPFVSWGNRFRSNSYDVDPGREFFRWHHTYLDLSGWKAATGDG